MGALGVSVQGSDSWACAWCMIARVSRACSASAAEASKEPATSPCCAPLVWLVRPAVPCVTCEGCECFQSVNGAMLGWYCLIASSMQMCSSWPKQFFWSTWIIAIGRVSWLVRQRSSIRRCVMGIASAPPVTPMPHCLDCKEFIGGGCFCRSREFVV